MPVSHALLAFAIMAVWGSNFVVMKVALADLPPLLFAGLRFTFALLPAIFFVKRPAVSWLRLAGFGLITGVGQFGLLYMAVDGHISPGLASLVIQTQVFFTIGLSIWLLHERMRGYQWVALLLGVGGIATILLHTDGDATPLGIGLVLGAAFCWAAGNLVAKAGPGTNMLAFIVWSSLFAAPPLLLLSLVTEGWPAIEGGLRAANVATWAAVLWQSFGNNLFGYAAWGWLLTRHPASTVAPTALLVPVFGMGASTLWLGESLPLWKIGAAALVLCGLALNFLWPAWRNRSVPGPAAP